MAGIRTTSFARAGVLLASAVLLFGCSVKVTDFAFQAHGKEIILLAPHGTPRNGQDGFAASPKKGDAPHRTPRYTLSPATAAAKSQAFFLDYIAAAGPLTLHVYEKNPSTGAVAETKAELPILASKSGTSARHLRFLLPLPQDTEIGGFQVTGSSSASTIRILGSGLTRDYAGVELGQDVVTMRDGVKLTDSPGSGSKSSTVVSLAGLVSQLTAKQAQIVVSYTFTGGAGPVYLTASGTSKEARKYYLFLRKGTHRLYLYTASVGFTPQSLEVTSDNPGFKIDSVSVHPFDPEQPPAGSLGATTPIPADFGAIIDYRPEYWRQQGYELFSWSLVPSVLVMQFASYAVQARYMKRFAFFIEKYGFTGKLRTNDQLAHLHGWNAHDYRPKDLARFYTQAAKESFTLNPEELHLRRILVANGLLLPDAGGYKAGKGAILTFAHVGPYWLRRLLLTHEGYHGILFTHPAYRKAVFAIWQHTPAMEQELFRNIFLYWAHYNIDDPYLVQNEFQAYLMQQPTTAVRGYFDNELSYEMKRMLIPQASPLMQYFTSHPDAFYKSALEVQKAVETAVGVTAGELVGLSPES